MAFALLVVGIILLTASIRNTQGCLIRLLQADFIGPGNFAYWIVALIVVGAIGYIDKLKKISDGLLVLIFVALFLSRGQPKAGGDFFAKLVAALKGTQTATPLPAQGSNLFPGLTTPGITIGIGGNTPTTGPRTTPGNPSPYPIPTGPTGLPSPFPYGGGGPGGTPGTIVLSD